MGFLARREGPQGLNCACLLLKLKRTTNMAIPKADQIKTPALRLLAEHDSLKPKQSYAPLAKYFKLTQEELEQKYERTSVKIFYDRVGWALSFLYRFNLATKPRRALYQISDKGRKLLEKPDGEVLKYIVSETKKREKQKREKLLMAEKEGAEYRAGISDTQEEVARSELPPEVELSQAFSRIKETACDEILETILRKSPRAFEKLVVELFSRMGYGEKVKVTPYSGDGGIDGVIKEDILGLGRIYIQAKRYRRENSVPVQKVREFAGTLQGLQAGKGVFITTSSYTKGARKFADSLGNNTSIVLIDGTELAEYIYDYGLGMQVRETIEIKKLDEDYWDSMEDDAQDNAL